LRRRLGQFIDRALGAPSRSTHIEHLVRLAAYSRRNVLALREEVGLTQAPRGTGLLGVYTDAKAFHARLARASHWSGLGCEERLLSADEAVAVEPALQPIRNRLVGATYLQEDPARDPAEFAASMVFLCRAAGVRFMNGHQVVSLAEREGRIDHVEVLDGEGRLARVRGQAYVLALGASSVPHAQALDIDMQLRFVREYIVTIPVKDPARAPRVALRDRQGRLRIARVETPQGDWLRVTTTVRAGADEDEEPDSDRFEAILQRIDRLLAGAADLGRAEFETAVHAVSRSRLPMIGKTRLPNLFLNSAPGTPDWVHVCGAGKSIARIVSGLRPELDFAFRRP
jgi:D-amino-acid dehydrogenase